MKDIVYSVKEEVREMVKIEKIEDGLVYVWQFYGECPGDEECFAEGGCGAVFSEEEVVRALKEVYSP